jgi:hypothetical protein
MEVSGCLSPKQPAPVAHKVFCRTPGLATLAFSFPSLRSLHSLLAHPPFFLLPAASNNPVTVVIRYPLLFSSGNTLFNIGTVQPLLS